MKKIFLSTSAVALLLVATAQPVDRSKKPVAGPAPVINIKDPVTFKLPNGMTVLVVENHTLPKVNATLNIDAGPVTEGSKAGMLDLLGGMLNEGTTTKTKAQYDEAVDQLGAEVSLSAGGGGVSALSRYFNQAFALFAEGLKSPAFPQASFEKLKSQTITGIKSNEKNVKAISAEVGNALIYGTNHPSGEMTTVKTVEGVTLADVKAAYKKYITPSRSYLTFVGDITPAAAKALATKTFGTWTGNPLMLEKLKPVSDVSTTEIDVVDMPNAVQSEIKVANLVNIPMSSPDYFPALLANQILGGSADARLFMNLREKHGFTYGSYSSVGTGRFQSAFNATASVRNDKTDSAVAEMLSEIKKIGTEPVSDEELKNAKARYNGSFAMSLEDPSRSATLASNILLNGLPKDFYETYLQKINAVTKEDIQRVAQKYFSSSNARLIVGGKQQQILPGLRKLGYPVKLYDKNAQPVNEPTLVGAAGSSTAAAKPAISAQQIISNYITAIGGEAELKKVTSVWMTGEMEMQGQKLAVNMKKQAPNKESMTIEMMGQTVVKNVFDGTAGYAMQMGQKKATDAAEIAEKKAVTTLFDQLSYATNGAKLEVAGTEKVNGADAYKVNVIIGDKTKAEYYDVKTGLLVKEEEARKAAGQDVTTSIEYKDYKKTGNILFPQTIAQSVQSAMGSQEFAIAIKEVKLNEGVSEADFK